jgi:hypothetical protein
MRAEAGAIFVSVSATDDSSLQQLFARTVYRTEDIVFDHIFQVG